MTHHVLVALAFAWITVDFWIVTRSVIFRETILASVARLLDRLPGGMNNFSFLVVRILVLLGWVIPLAACLKPSASKKALTSYIAKSC
jgi:hypothetical protein